METKGRNSANSAPPRRTLDTGFGATRAIGFRKQENFTAEDTEKSLSTETVVILCASVITISLS
jgi:hypothetical protein